MANRYPLIIDSTTKQIKEIPSGDNLNLTGTGITGLSALSISGSLTSQSLTTGDVTSSGNISATGNITTGGNLTVAGNILLDGTNILESIDYADVLNTPTLATVATSGEYNDLSNKPVLSNVALSGSYTDLLNRPTFANVATSGNYNDLSNRPSLAPVAISGDYIDLTNTPTVPSDLSDLSDNTGILSNLTFVGLSDVPSSYVGQAGKFIQVSLNETGLQFSDASSTITYTDVIDALGFTPYDSANPANYITTESDTFDTVVGRGAITASSITVGGLSSSGAISGSNLTLSGNIVLDNAGAISLDGAAGSTLTIGGGSTLVVNSQQPINVGNTILPATDDSYDLGSATKQFSNAYINDTVYYGDLQGIPGKANVTIGAAGNINLTAGTATSRVAIFQGVFKIPVLTTTQRNALSAQFGDIIYNNTTSQVQIYVAIASYSGFEPVAGWVNLYNPPPEPVG